MDAKSYQALVVYQTPAPTGGQTDVFAARLLVAHVRGGAEQDTNARHHRARRDRGVTRMRSGRSAG
jgi:hypothetical protein